MTSANDETIRTHAQEIWERADHPRSHAEEHWPQTKRVVKRERAKNTGDLISASLSAEQMRKWNELRLRTR